MIGSAEAGRQLATVLDKACAVIRPGISTADIADVIHSAIVERGAEPVLHGLYGFPASACISVNNEICHGIPSTRRKLKSGDTVAIDVALRYRGACADMARTVLVGEGTTEAGSIIVATREALRAGILAARAGNKTGDIGAAIERTASDHGYVACSAVSGHGIGADVHEAPRIPNRGPAGTGDEIKVGMVLAIEPVLTYTDAGFHRQADGWTIVSNDGSRSAHFEDTIEVTEDGPVLLTVSP